MRAQHFSRFLGRMLFPILFPIVFGGLMQAQDSMLIKAGTVLVGDGRTLTDVFVAVESGKIAFVGKGFVAPRDSVVLDFEDKVITPGFIAANAVMDVVRQTTEEGQEVTPRMNLLYSIDPRAEDFEKAWRGGVTCVYLAPGNLNVFNGTGTVIKTKGATPQDMLVRNQVHLKMVLGIEPGRGNSPPRIGTLSLRNRRPQNRMGVVFIIRYELTNVQNKTDISDSELTPDELLLRRVLEGEFPLRIRARSYKDIETAFRLMEEFGYQWILEDGVDAYRYLDELKARRIPVVYGPVYKKKGRPDFSPEDDKYLARTPVWLAEKNILFAFQNSEESPIGALREEAIFAVEIGLSREIALRALTLDAARILGVEDRLGSVAKGKDADLLVFDGDPLEPSSRLTGVILDGKFFDPNK